ncbi:hypothetical protein HZP15_06945 [Elizabethkingia anophelis]|nr:hypothetical protein [Elizabethkingia anophelis]
MNHYNGEFEHTFFVVIEAKEHDTCLKFASYIKKALEPWFLQTHNITEHKSARKGDVLRRDIYVTHIAYASDIIIFNEMLRTLIWHYNLYFDVKIQIDDRGTLPKDSRKDLLR